MRGMTMKKKIGQVILDDRFYPGKDLYSDGAVEDELLEIAEKYPEEELNRVIAERKSWPVLYHFSHVRENILSWLPFTGEESVLEIGSGCGAVTGALCARAKKVTCIELSRKRSMINAKRHKNCENLTILLGNFQEIEQNLKEQYDYITLIGVFEYGENYIDSDSPFVDFLKTVATHLKPGGKIVLAIENRFGLKYWAGCTEDHFGTLFEGLEGYPVTSGVKTFTKKELSAILEKAGGLKASWYYPFPDYKLPAAIYSDRRLPQKGELNRVETNYDRLRLQLFQESPVYDSLLDNDLFPEFSNSFLLLIGREETEIPEVYVKFSNERDPRFALRTEICQKGKYARYVRKTADTAAAEAHIRNLENIRRELASLYEKTGMELNNCRLDRDGIKLEYLEGITLEEKLDELLAKGEMEKLEELFFFYLKDRTYTQQRRFPQNPGVRGGVRRRAASGRTPRRRYLQYRRCSRQYSDPGGQSSGAGLRVDVPFPGSLPFYHVQDDPLLSGERRQAPDAEGAEFLRQSGDRGRGTEGIRGNGKSFSGVYPGPERIASVHV